MNSTSFPSRSLGDLTRLTPANSDLERPNVARAFPPGHALCGPVVAVGRQPSSTVTDRGWSDTRRSGDPSSAIVTLVALVLIVSAADAKLAETWARRHGRNRTPPSVQAGSSPSRW